MKRRVFLMTIFSLFLAVAAVSAQEKTTATDFSGSWELDVSKSKLGDRMRIESMTMNVTQTGTELKVESTSKRAPRPEGDTNPGGGMNRGNGGGGMGRGGMMGGDGTQTTTYSLDGKETKMAAGGQMGGDTTLKAKFEKDGILKLSSSRTISGQMGEMTITSKESWQLADGGKTLKVTREMSSPRGAQTTEMVFSKK